MHTAAAYTDSWPDYASQVTLEFVTASYPFIVMTTNGSTQTSAAGYRGGTRHNRKNSRFSQIFQRLKQKIQNNFNNLRSKQSSKNSIDNNYRYVRVVYNDEPQEIDICNYAYSLHSSHLSATQLKTRKYRHWCPYDVFMEILKVNMIRHKEYEKGCNKKT